MKTQAQSTISRRVFAIKALVATTACAGVLTAKAQATLDEADPAAVKLGYKANAGKVDKAKQPKYAVGQLCNNCALYQGAATASSAPCALFAGKQVAGKGWCNAWVKKG